MFSPRQRFINATVAAVMAPIAFAANIAEAQERDLGDIELQRGVVLNVGGTAILKGARNRKCGGRVPSWESIVDKLPVTQLGTFFNAGVGRTFSKACNRDVPALVIGIQGTKEGQETLDVLGDTINIKVQKLQR